MSVDHFEEPASVPIEDDLLAALGHLDDCQMAFFAAASRWARFPTARTQSPLEQASSDTGEAFQGAVATIIESNELDTREKALYLSSITIGADSKRTRAFGHILPDAKFAPAPNDFDSLSDKLAERLVGADGGSPLVEELTNIYARNFKIDVDILEAAVLASPRAKALRLTETGAHHLGDVAKITTSVVVAELISRRLSRRLDD